MKVPVLRFRHKFGKVGKYARNDGITSRMSRKQQYWGTDRIAKPYVMGAGSEEPVLEAEWASAAEAGNTLAPDSNTIHIICFSPILNFVQRSCRFNVL